MHCDKIKQIIMRDELMEEKNIDDIINCIINILNYFERLKQIKVYS